MKKKILFFIFSILTVFFITKDANAYSSSDYKNRKLCGNYEVVQFNRNGTITTKNCYSIFEDAQAAMVADGGADLAVLGNVVNETKVLSANSALVDLTNTSDLIYLYDSYSITGDAHTYINGQSGYGAVDGAFITTAYSPYANTFTTQIKIGGYTGWVRSGVIEIVPLAWVNSSSSYTVSNETIRHNYVTKIQNTYTGSSGTTIGPKPTMLGAGTYYSYDGHYFYNDRYKMVKDYKNGTYANAVNQNNPYYNYYQYLSNHTRTTYSSINIDEYIRNSLGYGRDVFGTTSLTKDGIKASRLYGKGTFFYNAQETYGVNALLALGLSRNETGNGTSNLAINKNNGFGLNAVDSNPTQAANWYASFSSSILGYANKWVTYGYADPNDWRYYGNQYGNKFVGMNVKYASDVYWGEKMASNYYFIDKALGLQDYNYYQLGVTKIATQAKASPNNSSKTVYSYRSTENALVILGEVQGQSINGNTTWYKVVSDLNIDSNFNEITSGKYNWNSYVYVPAAYVTKINQGKNGYISPNAVTEYQDKNYTYDLYIENTVLKPKVALSTKETKYYYDPSLLSTTGKKLLNNRYVMVFTAAYDENNTPVAYLVTSDYKYDQKHWVSADSIKFVTSSYGQASVTVANTNTYTIINPDTVDLLSTHISGLYHYAYVPILEEKTVSGQLWYKVPVDLNGTNLEFGWTLASAPDVLITKYQYTAQNTAPVIKAKDKQIIQGKDFNALDGVTAIDTEDGNITGKIKVVSNEVKKDIPGTYLVTYQVTDNGNATSSKTIKVTVVADQAPVINVSDKTITIGKAFDPKKGVTATDKEDGTITDIRVDDSNVNYDEIGEYEITYIVKDSFGHEVSKTITLTIKEELALEEKKENEGTFYFDYLNNLEGELQLRGYLTINGMNNTLNEDISYYVIFMDTENEENIFYQDATRITDLTGINRPIYSADGYTYTHSWFEIDIAVDSLPAGNYIMGVIAEGEEYYSEATITNKLYKTEITSFQSEDRSVNIKNNYSNRTSAVTLYVRDKDTPLKTVGSYYNQYDVWRIFEFVDNKLHLKGASYSYGMNLSKTSTVKRTMIFENKETYEKYKFDIGSITNGLYTVALPVSDNLDKTRAWYDATIDISTLPKGSYKIYITTTSNVTDYSEFTDNLGRDLSDKKIVIDQKSYQFKLNSEDGNCIELEVE